MWQTLFYIPPEIGSYPLFGLFGIAMGVWLVASVGLMAWLVYRYGWNESTLSYLPVLAVIGVMIAFLLPNLMEFNPDKTPKGLPIRGYGMMMLLGVLSGVGMAASRFRRMGLSTDLVFGLALWMLLPGIIGARLFFMIQKHDQFNWETPYDFFASVFQLHQGGLVVYGSLICGLAGGLIYCRLKRIPVLPVGDLIAPCMFIGLALGRVGCLFNGCCHGGPTETPYFWMVSFPEYSQNASFQCLSGECESDHGHSQRAHSPPYEDQRKHGVFYGIFISQDEQQRPLIGKIYDEAPRQAGLRVGDRVVAMAWVPAEPNKDQLKDIQSFDQVQRFLLASNPDESRLFQVTVARGQDQTVCRWSVKPLPRWSRPIHPTQIYSAINGALICLVLIVAYPFRRRDGETLALGLTLYALTRFLLEIIRTDESAIMGTGLTISQNVSILFIVGLVALWIFILRQPTGQLWKPPFPPGDEKSSTGESP